MNAADEARRLLSMYDSGHPKAAADAMRLALPALSKLVTEYETQQRRLVWWRRMSVGDIAAELSATFDLGLDVTTEIARWILEPAEEAPDD